ncbi:unnamed protein product [Gadus morhua 'NCC']
MGQQNLTEQMLLNNRALRSDASEWDHGIAIVTYAFVQTDHMMDRGPPPYCNGAPAINSPSSPSPPDH